MTRKAFVRCFEYEPLAYADIWLKFFLAALKLTTNIQTYIGYSSNNTDFRSSHS